MDEDKDRFVYLDHTADVKFQAFGRNIGEAFSNAVLATSSVIVDYKNIKPVIRKDIELVARNREALLYDLLDELIFLLDTEFFLAGKVEEMQIVEKEKDGKKSCSLRTRLSGDDLRNYNFSGDIKAATYNFMFVKEEMGKFTVQAVLDL